ncbi:MAG: uracil-DNA glycosylase [bacterium]|nr:uracil-DNA glycosylase [bacterium]
MDKNQQLKELAKRLNAKFKPQKLLSGKGHFNAPIMLVSEFPNAEEVAKDKPFLGAHGKILNKLLKELNIPKKNIYFTHAVKVSKNRNELPHPKEIKQFSHFLREEIKIIEPKLIVALGNTALRGLNVKLPLLNIRGRLIRFGTNSLFTTHHPSTVSTNPTLLPEIEKDFKQLAEAIKNLA